MNTGKNPQAEVIKKALAKDRWNLSSWARAHGYGKRTVYQTVERWAGRTDRSPHGGISRQIMADLRAQLGSDIVPEPIPSSTPSHRGHYDEQILQAITPTRRPNTQDSANRE